MAAPTINVLSLCSGVEMLEEGLRAGLEWLGWRSRVVCHVERDGYASACLLARMESAALEPAPIWSDLTTFDGRAWRGVVDCVTAGFPCQPWSHAGKQEGIGDERWLWPAIARIIRDSEPSLVFLENVPGLVSGGGLHFVLDDLAEMGFDAEWGHLTAASVGASHKRERVFILGHANSYLRARLGLPILEWQPRQASFDAEWPEQDVALSPLGGFGELRQPPERDGQPCDGDWGIFAPGPSDPRWSSILAERPWLAPAIERGFLRVVDGLACRADEHRADRLRCVGNGVVALQAAAMFVELMRRIGGMK